MQNTTQTAPVSSTNEIYNDLLATVKVSKFCKINFIEAPVQQSNAIKPSKQEKKVATIDTLVEEGLELSKLHERYNEEYVVRGNKALYELLASIYSYALRVNESPLKEEIIKRMKANLKEAFNIKSTKTTPWLTTVVKFVVRVDRQTASAYSRILQVAFDEKLEDKDMAAYIERRGGIAKIRGTEAAAQAVTNGGEITKERIQLMRELLLASWHKPQRRINYDGGFVMFPSKKGGDANKETKASESSFAHFLAMEGRDGEFFIVAASDFGRNFEDVILQHMSTSLPADMDVLRKGVKRMQEDNQKWKKENREAREALERFDAIPKLPA